MSEWYWAALIGGNLPVYIGIGWVIFDGWGGFLESLRYWLTPDAWSWLRGEWADDAWGELKLLLFILVCAAVVTLEHVLLGKFVL